MRLDFTESAARGRKDAAVERRKARVPLHQEARSASPRGCGPKTVALNGAPPPPRFASEGEEDRRARRLQKPGAATRWLNHNECSA